MMGQLDRDCIPPHAVTMWTDGRDIYVALPMTKGGTPFITRYSLSEGGLSKALEVLKAKAKEVLTPTAAQPLDLTREAHERKFKDQPVVKTTKAREKLLAETTQEQRDAAQALLRKLGLVK